MLVLPSGPAWAASTTNAPPADPTEISLEQLVKMEVPTVEAASKYKQKTTEAPASVTIITAAEIKRYGHRTLAEILSSAPGLYVSYDRNYSSLGVRGFNLDTDNNRVLLLVDGHRINNSLTDGAHFGTAFPLDVDLIERVEIVRGPGSSLYGNNAFFGVVNVITRKGSDQPGMGAEASGEAASHDTYKGRVTYAHQFTNGLELMLSGTIFESEGAESLFFKDFNTPANNYGVAVEGDADSYKSFFGRVAWRDVSVEGAFITREKVIPGAKFLADFNDPRLRSIDDRGYANVKYAHDFEQFAEVTAQVYYDRQNLDIGEPYAGTLYRDAQSAQWWGAELQLTRRFWDRLTLMLGGGYQDDFEQKQKYYDVAGGTVFRDVSRDRQNHGVYLQGDWSVCTNLVLSVGGRYDQYGDFDPSYNPRLALIYNPVDATVLKALYGTAFRAPNFFELSDPRNQNLSPEKITTYELVYEQGIGNHLRSSVVGFYNEIDDLIAFRNGSFVNFNAEARGVEVALEGSWVRGLRGRVSYTYQETRDRETNETLPDSPHHLAKINLSVPVWKEKVFFGVEGQLVSKRTTLGAMLPAETAGAYGVVNLTLFSQNLAPGLDISASVYNLLDRKYSDPATPFHLQNLIEQDGRTFRVKLVYRF